MQWQQEIRTDSTLSVLVVHSKHADISPLQMAMQLELAHDASYNLVSNQSHMAQLGPFVDEVSAPVPGSQKILALA